VIIRAKRKTNFTIISNVGMNDERLSFKAKGLLAYLLTKPDDWRVNERHLETVGPDGVTAVRAALKELELCGYLQRDRERDDQGLFVWTSIVYDEPCVDNPSMDKPSVDNRTLVSTEETSTDGVKTEKKAVEAAATAPTVGEAWADNMPGLMTPMILSRLEELEKEYSEREIVGAIEIAVKRNKRNLGYVEGVLRRGVDLPSNGSKPKTAAYITDPVTGEQRQVLA
jgi:DnaD/phage-associated family protein